jgi:NAD(P)-dependent dehydrogenase (short-subunit alcohol dehydrogenase family)
MDLGSQESVRNAAAEITKLTNHLDIIINNAAVMTLKHQYTMEGIETQFGSNHIGHFLLTNLLLPQMFSAAKSQPGGSTRVINLTSLGHRVSPIRFHDYNLEGKEIPPEEEPVQLPTGMAKATEGTYNGYVAYGQAKTANVLYSVELNRLFKGKGIVSYALHPGCKSKLLFKYMIKLTQMQIQLYGLA